MSDARKVKTFMVDRVGGQVLYVCRGPGRCLDLNRKEKCFDCVLADDEETLQEVLDRMDRGDA